MYVKTEVGVYMCSSKGGQPKQPGIVEFWFVHEPQNIEIEPNRLLPLWSDFFADKNTILFPEAKRLLRNHDSRYPFAPNTNHQSAMNRRQSKNLNLTDSRKQQDCHGSLVPIVKKQLLYIEKSAPRVPGHGQISKKMRNIFHMNC